MSYTRHVVYQVYKPIAILPSIRIVLVAWFLYLVYVVLTSAGYGTGCQITGRSPAAQELCVVVVSAYRLQIVHLYVYRYSGTVMYYGRTIYFCCCCCCCAAVAAAVCCLLM